MLPSNMNCWEYMECGQDKASGCPAYIRNKGRECWMVTGTFCDDQPSGTFAKKINSCTCCKFYRENNKE